ncbi:DUF4407 domain-containing protein [Nocardia sp. NBC_00508]|uniref:DUF4407 domain-containing protein n=1 Tax=Nocardia sp. NBC_00508 TaxID=2975992 RepID=UPI002E823DE9|nr:DUF4407 domain-containing protein [Nocardia sp. NBC_00508]WUD69480.1 DUF4407 domain-containing protein [Nocardia sp. NBC_00508]
MTVTGLFTWLGGGRTSEITDRHERAGYAVTGAAVLLFATISGAVAALAAASTAWPLWATITAALVIAALTAALARAVATARPSGGPDRLGLIARIAVAVLVGGLIAELAAVALFGASVDRMLDADAQRSAESAPQVVAAQGELDRAKADRAALDQPIAKAQLDIDRALVIARCEYNPTPECPQTRITGVPGRGPEAQTANDMLDDARGQLATAHGRVDAADRRIADDQDALSAARSASFDSADRGLGARWQAMNDYTVREALPLRILTIVAFVVLALLPLVLRWWRGETSFDRHNAARSVHDRAEREADTAIAVKQAEVRAEAETLRAEQQLTAARLAVEADTAIDRERQRTRIIAAIGGIEIGITEPPRRPELPAAADDRKDSTVPHEVTPNLPAPVTANSPAPVVAATPPAPQSGGLELPLIGTVPFTDTAARFIRPLVPSFVANAIDTATHPLRTARQAFEEVEEITFTLRRTRKVTIDGQTSHPQTVGVPVGYQLQPGSPEVAHAQHIASTIVDADYSGPHAPRYSLPPTGAAGYGLPTGTNREELPSHHHGELPHANRRELPPGR